jgi:hypothetical protein
MKPKTGGVIPQRCQRPGLWGWGSEHIGRVISQVLDCRSEIAGTHYVAVTHGEPPCQLVS